MFTASMPAGAVVPSVPVPVPAASHSHIHHQATPPSSSLTSTAHLNPSEAGPEASTGSSPLITRAVVANDTDVSNGFVKDGKTLPYVFEANDAGFRKRSSKILPICAICNRKFVCVTTMKRHLVTHTGQKPFSCRECGKQYTQKGNLRVHERTHRNDRPFECNICHQKFFRKEPMQKHQWRQHGIVHAKLPESLPPSVGGGLPTPVEDEVACLQFNHEEVPNGAGVGGNHHQPPPPLTVQPQPVAVFPQHIVLPLEPKPLSTQQATSDVEQPEDFSSTRRPSADAPPASPEQRPPRAHSQESRSLVPRFQFSKLSEKYEPVSRGVYESPTDATALQPPPPKAHSNSLPLVSHLLSQRSGESGTRGDANGYAAAVNLSSDQPLDSNPLQEQPPSSNEAYPGKLKMKLAQAYMLEVRSQEQQQEGSSRELGGNTSMPPPAPPTVGESVAELECTCKSCGQSFVVTDPYNLVCSKCGYKFPPPSTSTAPSQHSASVSGLQCAGCNVVFPHKPALKAHQMDLKTPGVDGGLVDKERPFKCCVCSYQFRQKAHLLKHQWRIHQSKDNLIGKGVTLEDEIVGQPPNSVADNFKVTIQDIINHCVEPSIQRCEAIHLVPTTVAPPVVEKDATGETKKEDQSEARKGHQEEDTTEPKSKAAKPDVTTGQMSASVATGGPGGAALDLSPAKLSQGRTKTGRLHNIIVSIDEQGRDEDGNSQDSAGEMVIDESADDATVGQNRESTADETAGTSPAVKKAISGIGSSHVNLPSISGLLHKPPPTSHLQMFGQRLLPSEVVATGGGGGQPLMTSGDKSRTASSLSPSSCQNVRTV